MKTKTFVLILLLVFLAAVPNAEAQSRKDRKLKREMAKLEKQMKKVHDLRGENIWISGKYLDREWERDLAQAMRARELSHIFERDFPQRVRSSYIKPVEKVKWIQRDAMKHQREAMELQRRAMDKNKVYQREAMEKAMEAQREAMKEAKMYQQEVIEKLKEELRIAKKELEEEKEKK